jgi:hypothetical protein
LIQRFAWYSTTDRNFNGHIYEEGSPPPLSAMGQNWANYVSAMPEETELQAKTLRMVPPLAGEGNADVELTAVIANSGNTLAPQTFTVRFYNGDPAQGGQMIGSDQTVSLAGCGARATASTRWNGVAQGVYQLFAQADAGNVVAEPDETNNLASTTLFFATDRVWLPSVMRQSGSSD